MYKRQAVFGAVVFEVERVVELVTLRSGLVSVPLAIALRRAQLGASKRQASEMQMEARKGCI